MEVKKLGTDKGLMWKLEGYKIQFLYNTELGEIEMQIS